MCVCVCVCVYTHKRWELNSMNKGLFYSARRLRCLGFGSVSDVSKFELSLVRPFAQIEFESVRFRTSLVGLELVYAK